MSNFSKNLISEEFFDSGNWIWKDLDPDDELLIAFNRRPSEDMVSMCALCYMWFKSRDELHEHMVTHIHNSHFHECSICHKKFIARFLCARHETMHRYESNLPYCRYWEDADTLPLDFYVKNHPVKRFKPVPYSRYYLKLLRRLEKRALAEPISCIACSKVFDDHDSLQQHYDNSHAVHECIFCYEILETSALYAEHLRQQHDLVTPTNYPGGLWGILDEYVTSVRSEREQILENIRFFHSYASSPKEEEPPKSNQSPVTKPRTRRLPNTTTSAQQTTTTTTLSTLLPNSHSQSNHVVLKNHESSEDMDLKLEKNCDVDKDLEGKADKKEEEDEEGEEEEEDEDDDDENNDSNTESEKPKFLTDEQGKNNNITNNTNIPIIPIDQEEILEMSFDDISMTLDGKPLPPDSIIWVEDQEKEENILYACQICGKLFSDEKMYNRHRRLHTAQGKNFDCKYCGKAFATHSNRKEHERIHSGERPYKCPICERSFIQISNLKKHIQTHKELNHLQCKICNKQFVKESSLVLHQRAHATERKFRCNVCDKAYNYASLLKRHMRIHSGECPYQCVECNLPFHELVSLHYHRKKMHTHERPHKCEFCGRGFILSSDLKKHHKVHLKKEAETGSPPTQKIPTTTTTITTAVVNSNKTTLTPTKVPSPSPSSTQPTTTTTTTATTSLFSSPSPPLLNNHNSTNHFPVAQECNE